MGNKVSYFKFEPRRVMSEDKLRLKTLLIERIRVGANNDLYSANMLRAKKLDSCKTCGAHIGEYHKTACTQELCPRCGELHSQCKCTEEYAVYITEADNQIPISQNDEKSDELFNKIMNVLESRLDTIESKLDKMMPKVKSNFGQYPTILPHPKSVLKDPPYMTSRDRNH